MNPHARAPTSLLSIPRTLWRHWRLIGQMTRRDVLGRYSGSIFGIAWSAVIPLLMLVIYTFVFSVVFKARWGASEESKVQFALVLYSGLLVHGLFAEVLSRATGVVVSQGNFVKKVIFPLEILPVVSTAAAIFHTGIGVAVFLAAFIVLNGAPPWTVVFLPFVFLPLIVLAQGLAWFLAALGVYVRDIGQVIGLVTTVLLFMSPVFYPTTALPAELRPWLHLNPLTYIIEQVRQVAIWGHPPDVFGLLLYFLVALLVCWAGFFWFQRTRRGFSDVL